MSSANNRMFSVTLYQDFSPRSKAHPKHQDVPITLSFRFLFSRHLCHNFRHLF